MFFRFNIIFHELSNYAFTKGFPLHISKTNWRSDRGKVGGIDGFASNSGAFSCTAISEDSIYAV